MQRISKQWRRVMVIATFCLMFGGTAVAPTALGAAGIYTAGAYQGGAVYLPPSPCRGYYLAY